MQLFTKHADTNVPTQYTSQERREPDAGKRPSWSARGLSKYIDNKPRMQFSVRDGRLTVLRSCKSEAELEVPLLLKGNMSVYKNSSTFSMANGFDTKRETYMYFDGDTMVTGNMAISLRDKIAYMFAPGGVRYPHSSYTVHKVSEEQDLLGGRTIEVTDLDTGNNIATMRVSSTGEKITLQLPRYTQEKLLYGLAYVENGDADIEFTRTGTYNIIPSSSDAHDQKSAWMLRHEQARTARREAREKEKVDTMLRRMERYDRADSQKYLQRWSIRKELAKVGAAIAAPFAAVGSGIGLVMTFEAAKTVAAHALLYGGYGLIVAGVAGGVALLAYALMKSEDDW